ncbi:T9SS type A sorting domain-containing protein [candidate division WOR-3 bacterium]|nr:T9SS type A sorting domain-containing protein [candidate division WOR-3 bacterium]
MKILSIFGALLFFSVTAQAQTIFYFQNSTVAVGEPMPNTHQTGDTFMGGTWIGRAMLSNKGTSPETLSTDCFPGTGYYECVTFISEPMSAQIIPAGDWTIDIQTEVTRAATKIYVRYMIYQWVNSTDAIGTIIVNATSDVTKFSKEKTLITVSNIAGSGCILSDGDKICLDLEMDVDCPSGQAGNFGYFYYGNNSVDTSRLVFLGSITTIGLTGLSAISTAQGINLKWRTESEMNKFKWIVERSLSPKEGYTVIDEIPAQGNCATPTEYFHLDRNVEVGKTYYYKLIDVDLIGNRTVHGQLSATFSGNGSKTVSLHSPYPNPTLRTTMISYDVPDKSFISLEVYNIAGQLIKTLMNEFKHAGTYKLSWDGTNESGKYVPAGIYFYRLTSDNFTSTKRINILR